MPLTFQQPPAIFQPLNTGFTPDTLTALVLMNDNSLVLYQNGSTTTIDTNVMAFQGLAVDQIFTLHTDGTMYYLPYQLPVSNVSNVQAFYALSPTEFLVIHTNGDLYLCQIDGLIVLTSLPFAADVRAVQALDATDIFFLQTDGVLYYKRYNPDKPSASGWAIPVFGPVPGLAPGQVPVPPVQDFQYWSNDAVVLAGRNLYYAAPPFNVNQPLQLIQVNPILGDVMAFSTLDQALILLVLTYTGELYYYNRNLQGPKADAPKVFEDVVAMYGYQDDPTQTVGALAVTSDGTLYVLAAPSWTANVVLTGVALAPPPLTAPIIAPYRPPRGPIFL